MIDIMAYYFNEVSFKLKAFLQTVPFVVSLTAANLSHRSHPSLGGSRHDVVGTRENGHDTE